MSQLDRKAKSAIAGLDVFRVDNDRLSFGEPLEAFQGVLRGVPNYVGDHVPLLEGNSW